MVGNQQLCGCGESEHLSGRRAERRLPPPFGPFALKLDRGLFQNPGRLAAPNLGPTQLLNRGPLDLLPYPTPLFPS